MSKFITAALLSLGLIVGGAGVASAGEGGTVTPTGSASGSASGSAELMIENPELATALLSLLLATGSAMTDAPAVTD